MENSETNPPYGSVNRLSYVFGLFSTHNFSQITSSFLKNRGFSGSDAFQTISGLKFLGILDNEGKRTEKMNKLQLKGEERTQAVMDILKNAYGKLFETVDSPNKLSKDDLYNDFISIYGLSGRLASTAVPNFLWLCKEAGLEVSDAPEIRERKTRLRDHGTKAVRKEDPKKQTPSPSSYNNDEAVEVGEFHLVLPEGWDIKKTRQAIVTGKFKIIYDELVRLSPDLKKSTEENAAG